MVKDPIESSEEELTDLQLFLRAEAFVTAHLASGSTPQDYLYDAAESVRHFPAIAGFVFVTYKGKEYPGRVEWGPLDGDRNKSTVLIKTEQGLWVRLWFYTSSLSPQQQE